MGASGQGLARYMCDGRHDRRASAIMLFEGAGATGVHELRIPQPCGAFERGQRFQAP
jgi:hypothetical protein